MKTFVTSMMLAATALTLAACSGKHDETATSNEVVLSNDDFTSGQENLADDATLNAALDNAADPTAGASVTNGTLGNETAGNTL